MNNAGLYSRSAGLIENDALQRKRVLIIGLGSCGSQIVVDLAKAAVDIAPITNMMVKISLVELSKGWLPDSSTA